MNIELNSCPFCGKSYPRLYQAGGYWRIKCVDGCSVQITGYSDKAKCVEDWNRRPPEHANITVADLLDKFAPGTQIHIGVIFRGEYRIGYSDNKYIYFPGSGSYYPLVEAIDKCLAAYQDSHLTPHKPNQRAG